MIPTAQKRELRLIRAHPFNSPVIDFGDPMEDLSVATVLMLIGGRLILLRPRKVKWLICASFNHLKAT